MNAEQWQKRADVWWDRLQRLAVRLQANKPQNNRIHNRLFGGVSHALQMASLSARIERGCGHDTSNPHALCSVCNEAIN